MKMFIGGGRSRPSWRDWYVQLCILTLELVCISKYDNTTITVQFDCLSKFDAARIAATLSLNRESMFLQRNKGKQLAVGPVLLGFFLFVVVGSGKSSV